VAGLAAGERVALEVVVRREAVGQLGEVDEVGRELRSVDAGVAGDAVGGSLAQQQAQRTVVNALAGTGIAADRIGFYGGGGLIEAVFGKLSRARVAVYSACPFKSVELIEKALCGVGIERLHIAAAAAQIPGERVGIRDAGAIDVEQLKALVRRDYVELIRLDVGQGTPGSESKHSPS
jgi:hypothetical protein